MGVTNDGKYLAIGEHDCRHPEIIIFDISILSQHRVI